MEPCYNKCIVTDTYLRVLIASKGVECALYREPDCSGEGSKWFDSSKNLDGDFKVYNDKTSSVECRWKDQRRVPVVRLCPEKCVLYPSN